LASDLLSDRRRLERQIGELDGRIAEAVGETSASLTEVYGLGPILAAKIIGRVGDVRRFPSKGHYFASYTGTAPVEASRAASSCAIGSRGQETGSALRRSTHRWTCSAMRTRSSRLSAPRHKFDA
jgi:transposase